MKVTGSTIQQLEKDKPRGKCRRWRLWATTEEGRRSRRFAGTWTQAQDALSAFVAELEGHVPNAETFGAYAESWRLWREQSGSYTPNTVVQDARKVRALRRTGLDEMRMDEIGPDDCREALMWLRDHPARSARCDRYTNTSMDKFHQTLKAILAQAVQDGRLARNPMDGIRPPKLDTRERDALSPDELQLFLNRVDQLPLDGRTMALYLMACLGLRRGEACAVLDSEVSDVVRVTGSVSDVGGKRGPTKSEAGVRALPVPPRLAEKIAEWRALRARIGLRDAPTLCCTARGGVMVGSVLGAWWRKVRDGLGCGGMTLHQLRHSNLSMMARHMSAHDLQRYAGWARINMALVYVHDDMDAVARAVAEAWGGNGRTRNAPDEIPQPSELGVLSGS